MNKLTSIKIKHQNGTYSDEIPIGVLAENVDWDSNKSIKDIIGNFSNLNTNNKTDLVSAINDNLVITNNGDSLLQTQINQIVAPTGEAPNAAQIENARIGENGTVYDTLGNAIRTQVTKIKKDLYTNNAVDFTRDKGTTGTHQAVTYTNNGNGTWTVNGTASAASFRTILSGLDGWDTGLEAGKTYYVKYNSTDANVVLRIYPYYSGSIGSILLETSTDTEFTIPSDASGLAVRLFVGNGKTVNNATVNLKVLNAFPQSELTQSINNRIPYQRKFAFFGDSIMWGRDGNGSSSTRVTDTIPVTVAKRLGVTCDNFGVGGMGFLRPADSTNEIAYDKISTTNITGYDVIVLCFGANDGFQSVGTYDSTDETTCLGQFNKIINYIYTQNSTAYIIVFAPFNGTNAGSYPNYWYGTPGSSATSRKILSDALKKACEYYWIPYIEQTTSPINAKTITAALPDGVHPSETYYKKLGDWFSGKIISVSTNKNPNIDGTLVQSGQAADAAVVGNKIAEIKEDLSASAALNCANIFDTIFSEYRDNVPQYYTNQSDGTHIRTQNDVTFSWDAKYQRCTINGTSSATAVCNIYYSTTSLPSQISIGQRLVIEHTRNEINDGYFYRIEFYKDNSTSVLKSYTITQNKYILYVPTGATGMGIRIRVNSGQTITNGIFQNFIIRTSNTNEELTVGSNSPMLTIIDDDGDTHFLYDLVPLIQELHVPIASAVTTTRIGSASRWMSWEQIKTCAENGAEILCHMYSHPTSSEIAAMSENEIQHHLYMAKNYMKVNGVDSDVLVYSYSTGTSSDGVKLHMAAERVFDCAFAVNGGTDDSTASEYNGVPVTENSDRYMLPRYRIDLGYNYDLATMKAIIDDIAANGGWAVWMIHTSSGNQTMGYWRAIDDGNGNPDLNATPDSDGTGNYLGKTVIIPKLREAIQYAISKGVPLVTAEYGLKKYFNT